MTGIEALPNGQWVVAGDTHLGAWAKQHGNIITDPHLFQWLKPHLDGAKVVWDLGANVGDHTRQYLDWGMQVVAVEPNPIAYACLVNNCPEATLLNVAASDKPGMLRFAQLDNVGASRITEAGMLEVVACRLDDMDLPAPDFIKIDVEGYEPFAIMGLAETIRRHKPIIYCEMNPGALAEQGQSVDGLRDLIASFGYRNAIPYPPNAKFSDPQFDLLFIPDP